MEKVAILFGRYVLKLYFCIRFRKGKQLKNEFFERFTDKQQSSTLSKI